MPLETAFNCVRSFGRIADPLEASRESSIEKKDYLQEFDLYLLLQAGKNRLISDLISQEPFTVVNGPFNSVLGGSRLQELAMLPQDVKSGSLGQKSCGPSREWRSTSL